MYSEYHKTLLIRSLDSELAEEERTELTVALEASPKLRSEQEELLRLRQTLGDWQPATQRSVAAGVLDRIGRQKNNWEARIVRLAPRVAAASLLLLLGTMLSLYFTNGQATDAILVGVQDLTPEDAYVLLGDI